MNLKIFITLFLLHFFKKGILAQEVVNIVLVGTNGVTEDIKEATSFVAVKTYPGNTFERLDYKMGGPLIKLRTYNDSNLSILDGSYIEYDEKGNIFLTGTYSDNKKNGDWLYYNDTGKVMLTRVFEHDSLIKTVEPDTIQKKNLAKYPDEREAIFKAGNADWSMYLSHALQPDIGNKSKKGGKVKVQFVVDTTGKTTHIYLRKSAEFVLDEEGLRVIRNSPLWQPAFQNGRKVKAYRTQPFTFMIMED
ncbi:MAG TPA: energy transducer TonB [Ferruginibacter sp.]|nr:energy transducer TonB [Ferruginibacter sp.]